MSDCDLSDCYVMSNSITNTTLLNMCVVMVKIMDTPRKNGDELVAPIQRVLALGVEHADLRDEIYFQLVKQTTPAPENPFKK